MALPRLRLLPGFLLALTVLAELAAVALSWRLEPTYDTLLYAVFSCSLAGAGALILGRHPGHVIGWLLLAVGVENAVAGELAQGWGLRAAAQGWPGGAVAEWIATASFLPQGPAFVAILLLFPTGRLPSRRWAPTLWLSVIGLALAEPGWALGDDASSQFADGINLFAVESLPTDVMYIGGFVLLAAAMVAAFVAAARRFRSSEGVERQQMKWFALSSGILVLTLPASAALWNVASIVHLFPAIALTAWPITIGVAILRYRLYDVDLVISRTFAYAALTTVLAAVYAGAVVVLGAVAGRDSAWVTAAATLLAAVVFKLLHRRVQERVDRRFRPDRADALKVVAGFVDELRNDRVEPEAVVDALRAAVGDPSLELRFVLEPHESPVDERGRPASGPEDHAREVYPVRRGGTVLGQVVWSPRRQEDRALLPSVVAAAVLPIEMARFRVELRRRLDEVAESRSRLAAVADQERRRLERDLHDGAQQRLVSIGLALRHAQHQMTANPAGARRTLDGAVVEISAAIEELRELANGLRPTLLRAGLGPALRELANRSPVPVEVSATADRFPPDLEAAAYFVACEGLTNAVKHARAEQVMLQVARQDTTLVVSVADDGVGGAAVGLGSGLTGLSDRVAARGGRLRIQSVRGCGTTLKGSNKSC
ncbi:sensor histidine kinase [Streptomyces sp. NPDC102384]|uniref:sensor histidine kinase n=1 Tax=Streptomyces sp. NPDC102384 TaxID=3366166 RepID=UPI003801DCE0